MPALTSLTLNDGNEDVDYLPRDIKNGVGLLVSSAASSVGEKRLTIAMRKANTRFRGDLKMSHPVVAVETINGVDRSSVLRTNYIDSSVNFAEDSTQEERNAALALHISFLQSALASGTFADLGAVYG
jgi:hypothetical protein